MDWSQLRKDFVRTPDGDRLCRAVGHERAHYAVYPRIDDTFRAFNLTPLDRVRVVILGQDPYHGSVQCPTCGGQGRVPGTHEYVACPATCVVGRLPQANGLAFSVNRGVPLPPSLRNIFEEVARTVPGWTPPAHGDLSAWARQGVLLLNAALTVRAGEPGSHLGIWSAFTRHVLRTLWDVDGLTWMIWGKHALTTLADATGYRPHAREAQAGNRLVLSAAHPSPLSASRGFYGCGHFARVDGIDWRL